MFRSAFRSTLRSGVLSSNRRLSSARHSRGVPKLKLVAFAGITVLASSAFLSRNTISNDIDVEKVVAEQVLAENEAEREKTAFELTGFIEETADSPEISKEESSPSDIATKEDAEPSNEGEESGSQSAAFNPETGEINWDCPCLGGMADGPCGEEFKAAFSCFVYSETEPKGIDCIGKFEAMRTCFRQHPEHYKEELYEDDEPVPSTETQEQVAGIEKGEEKTPVEAVKESISEVIADKTPATEDISKPA